MASDSVFRFVGGGPEGAVLLEPFLDGLVEADVVPEFFRSEKFVPQDLVHLQQEEAPEGRDPVCKRAEIKGGRDDEMAKRRSGRISKC